MLKIKWEGPNFNATTAFLLPVLPLSIASYFGWISMPPRRSCFTMRSRLSCGAPPDFNATTAFLLRCPACSYFLDLVVISMPPRRSCFG